MMSSREGRIITATNIPIPFLSENDEWIDDDLSGSEKIYLR
jgi:hypothetical protein